MENNPNDKNSFEKMDDEQTQGFADKLKKLLTMGMGAAFLTEESVRTYLNELKLPKDVLNMLLAGAQKSKEELLNRVGKELVQVVRSVDFVKEASRFLEEHKFKIEVEISKKDTHKDSDEK